MGRERAGWDFYALKALVESLVEAATRRQPVFAAGEHPILSAGRSARALVGEQEIGWLGEAKAAVREACDLSDPVYLAELDLDLLRQLAAAEPKCQPISRFPAITRDIAFLAPRTILAAAAEEVIRAAAGDDLESAALFDAYEGAPLPAGRRNLAFSLTFRRHDRTLSDNEVEAVMERVRDSLRQQLGAQIRE